MYRSIKVVAAIIIEDGNFFATQRGYGAWKDWWEFPGGKVLGKWHYRHADDVEDVKLD